MQQSTFKGEKILITGGLGSIGSNLAHRLVELEAEVLLVDRLISVQQTTRSIISNRPAIST